MQLIYENNYTIVRELIENNIFNYNDKFDKEYFYDKKIYLKYIKFILLFKKNKH